MTRRYAENTKVGVAKSRAEIAKLLQDWGADSVHWEDNFRGPTQHTLRFVWRYKEHPLTARFALKMDRELIEKESIDNRNGQVSELKLEKNLSKWSQETHRTLLIMLKGIFNAIALGIIKPEAILITFTEDYHGNMLGDVLADRLIEMQKPTARGLLRSNNSEEA